MGNPNLFAVVTAISVVTFIISCLVRFRLLTVGKPEDRISWPVLRLREMLVYAFGQKRVVSYTFGLNHFLIFWSFLVLALANADFVIAGINGHWGIAAWLPGIAPLLFALFDVVSLLTLAVIGLAVARRLFFPPNYIEARSRDAFVILGMIAVLMLAFFGTHAGEIAIQLQSYPDAPVPPMPVSRALAAMMGTQSAAALHTIIAFWWWVHAVVLLAFLNYLPYSKHMHILTAIPNCFLRRFGKANILPREDFTLGNTFGVGQVDGFTWKDLFDSYSCTECGRCQHVCPASATAKPLSPREVVHDIKMNLLANGPRLLRGETPALPLIGGHGEGQVSEAAIWSCTSCGACMEVCPVFIEQMPKILLMRRHLVETETRFPEELLNLFENMEQRSNPWGIAPGERTKWCADLEVKPFSEETEYLFFVGCAGAFDSRNKQVTLSLARILDAAGVSWGILGKDEQCCGDSLRRLGNEYVFDRMARENIETFRQRGVKKIITQCPHCFSTLKNDYTQYGADLEVLHHSEFIARLLREGRIPVKAQAAGKVVFHDSCYLGRHNEVYDAPRAVATAACGSVPAEMGRHHANSFCCGAGGGRMWMEEAEGSRINLERVHEALREKPETICVSCPYCLTMFEDGLKDTGADDTVRVKDIAEMLAERLAAPKTATRA